MYNDMNVSRWYVIHTHPKQEDRADENLRAWKVETYSPKYRARQCNQFTGRPTYSRKPLFPRYIFARFNLKDSLHKVRFTRGVKSVVGLGNDPTPVDDRIIAVLQSQSSHEGLVKIESGFKTSEEVTVKFGPLRGFTGIFEREMKDSARMMILLNTVTYQSHIVIERELVKRTSRLENDY
jgi:transcriptional antiterminator RfaH